MEFADLGITEKPGFNRYYTICPECNDKREKHKGALCLSVNNEPGNRWYKCHHCGWSGNIDVQDRYSQVREQAKLPSIERTYSLEVREYLKNRGISLNTAKKAGIYEFPRGKDIVLGFPYFMHMTLVNVKFLNMAWKKGDKGPKWYQLTKDIGTRIIPFGMNQLKTHDDVGKRFKHNICIITEGEWDMLSWKECGYNNVISVPQGAPSLNSKDFQKEFAYLQDKYVQSILVDIDTFYLSTDNDEAGKKLQYHLSIILGKDKCRILRYPIGYKDANEMLAGDVKKNLPALGKKALDDMLANAQSVPIKGVIKASHVYEDLNTLRNDGFTPGLGCGVKEVDKLFTVKPKHVSFITGVPGSGKSVWTRWWLTEMIRYNESLDLKWALFTPENRPVAREYAKIAEALTGKTIKSGQSNSLNDEEYRQALRFIEKHFFIISPDRVNYEDFGGKVNSNSVNTLDSIEKYVTYLKKTENIFGYVIDAWNKIEHEQSRYETETTFISKQLDRVINFNDLYDLHGIIIVHPRKIEMVGENYKMPSLYDIKGSSAWKEKADIGIIIHRYKMKKLTTKEANSRGIDYESLDEDEKWEVVKKAPTIIRTEKIRFEETGSEDRVKMEMNTWGRFSVVDPKVTPIDKAEDKTKTTYEFEDDEDDNLPF